jgi:signal transduction histidine kinase
MLCALLLALTFGAWGLRYFDQFESSHIQEAQRTERERLLQSLLQLTGQSLQNFANDYGPWDEMVRFVTTGDPSWAAINIDASLPTFNAQAAWVLRADGHIVYQATQAGQPDLRTPPFDVPAVLVLQHTERARHFFAESPAGLVEVRMSPILPSGTIEPAATPAGWFVVGRLWNGAHLKKIGNVLASQVSLLPPQSLPRTVADTAEINLSRPLLGWDGRIVRVLHVNYRSDPMANMWAHYDQELILTCLGGLIVLVFTYLALTVWVIKPLSQLEKSLRENSPAPLTPLLAKQDEFGLLARLTDSSFSNRRLLQHEVEERSRAELALRRSNHVRTRLARDLHDSVIQSIYAAGLGLEGVRENLRHDPAGAEKRLAAAVTSLNQTIGEVRAFINGLEPEHGGEPQFAQALRALVDTLQSLHPLRLALEIDEAAAAQLTDEEELHALQIVREAASNALRHSGATLVTITLRLAEGRAWLSVQDNGDGFDPAKTAGRGSGLVNMAARVREFGGRLEIKSAPGAGAVITISFPAHPAAI